MVTFFSGGDCCMNAIVPKTVVITGASSGIGRACVSRMIQSGWRVFATIRKPEDGVKLQSEFGTNLTPLILDVTDRPSIKAAAGQVSKLHGTGLDGLVNVAGIGMARPIEYSRPAICNRYSISMYLVKSPSFRRFFPCFAKRAVE
jgi:NAD(P)-dependent dehydrogenase (short-subunit alcohol dehydrogenase family)